MFLPFKVRDIFGKIYAIRASDSSTSQKHLRSLNFQDLLSAQRFLHNLDIEKDGWLQLSSRLDQKASDSVSDLIIEDVAQRLLLGKVRVYSIADADNLFAEAATHVVQDDTGKSYQIVPESFLFEQTPKSVKRFANTKEAVSFVRDSVSDDEQLRGITDYTGITKTGEQTHYDASQLVEKLGEALVTGKAVVLEDKPRPPASTSNNEEHTEAVAGAKEVPLAPATEENWCNVTVKEKKTTGASTPLDVTLSIVLPSSGEQDVSSGSSGLASVAAREDSTFDIKQVETKDEDVIFEFVSLG